MAFVLDASVTASWFFPDENHRDAMEAWRRSEREEVWVPAHWWFEIRNTLLVGERRGRIHAHFTSYSLSRLSILPINMAERPDDEDVFAVARKYRLTFYDAAYLELARRHGIALATLDRDLAEAAGTEGVALVLA